MSESTVSDPDYTSSFEVPLELSKEEATYLAYIIRQYGTHPFRVKLFDAVLQMESGISSPFSISVVEPELWFVDEAVRDDSKDINGLSMRPLLRKVWKLLVQLHRDELLEVPDLAHIGVTE